MHWIQPALESVFTASVFYSFLAGQPAKIGDRPEDKLVNPRLVVCLLSSMVLGICAAVLVVAAGWGILAAIAMYSLVGSVCLVGTALLGSVRRPESGCQGNAKAAAA